MGVRQVVPTVSRCPQGHGSKENGMAVRSVVVPVDSRDEIAGDETERARSAGVSVTVRSRALSASLK